MVYYNHGSYFLHTSRVINNFHTQLITVSSIRETLVNLHKLRDLASSCPDTK